MLFAFIEIKRINIFLYRTEEKMAGLPGRISIGVARAYPR